MQPPFWLLSKVLWQQTQMHCCETTASLIVFRLHLPGFFDSRIVLPPLSGSRIRERGKVLKPFLFSSTHGGFGSHFSLVRFSKSVRKNEPGSNRIIDGSLRMIDRFA